MIYTSENIKFCPDGKYRWVYELDMYKNPTILFLVLKIFGVLFAIPCLLMLLPLFEGKSLEYVWDKSKYALFMFGLFFLCVFIGYYIVANKYGGKYCVIFEMDEEGVLHRQLDKQFEKAKAMSNVMILAGLLAGSPGRVGQGLLVATHSSIYSSFSRVRKVKPYRKRNLIKVNGLLYHNQVYMEDEDFDFVYDYIRTRCPKVKQ